jgi:hypothetical protein
VGSLQGTVNLGPSRCTRVSIDLCVTHLPVLLVVLMAPLVMLGGFACMARVGLAPVFSKQASEQHRLCCTVLASLHAFFTQVVLPIPPCIAWWLYDLRPFVVHVRGTRSSRRHTQCHLLWVSCMQLLQSTRYLRCRCCRAAPVWAATSLIGAVGPG